MGERFGMQRDVIQIPLVAGHDQSASQYSEESDNPRLQLVLNAEYTKKNTIAKRHGFERCTTNSYSADLCRLVNYKDSLWGIDSEGLVEQMIVGSEYVQNTLNTETDTTFYLPELMNEKSIEISRLDYQADRVDIASSSLYDVTVYVENENSLDTVYALIKNRESGTLVLRYAVDVVATSDWAVGNVKICANTTTDGYFCVLWSVTHAEACLLYHKVLDLTKSNVSEFTYSARDGDAFGLVSEMTNGQVGFDITPHETGSQLDGWAIVYAGLGAPPNEADHVLYARTIYRTGSTRTTATEIGDVGEGGGPWYGISTLQTEYTSSGTNYLWVVAWCASGLYMTVRNTLTLAAGGDQAMKQISSVTPAVTDRLPPVLWRGESKQFVYCMYHTSVEYDAEYPANGLNITTNAPFIVATVLRLYYTIPSITDKTCHDLLGLHPLSKGFKSGNKLYAWMADYTSRTAYLINFPLWDEVGDQSYRIVTQCDFGLLWASAPSKLFTVTELDDEWITGARHFMTPLIGENLSNPNMDYAVGFAKFRTYKDPEYSYQTEIVEDTAYISGGLLMNYDGISFQENNFIQIPQLFVEAADTTADPFELGTYSYIMCYEYIDAKGNKHRSVPSKPVELEVKRTLYDQDQYLSPSGNTDIIKTSTPSGIPSRDYWYIDIKVTSSGAPGTGAISFRVPDGDWSTPEVIAIPPLTNSYHGFSFLFKAMSYTKDDVYYVNYTEIEGSTDLDISQIYVDFNSDQGVNNRFRYTFKYNESSPEDSPWWDNDGKFYHAHLDTDKNGYFHFTTDGYTNGYEVTDFDGINESGFRCYFAQDRTYYEDTWIDVSIDARTHPYVSFFPNLYTYRHNDKCILSVYRTLKNGEIYYRLPNWEEVGTWSMQAGDSLINDPLEISTLRYSFLDAVKDEDLQYHEILYSPPDGTGVLPNDHPYGGVKCIKFHKNRLFMSSAENPCQIMYTKEYERGTPLSYSLGQDIFVPEPVTGLASHDEKLVIFTRKGIYILLGSGPDATGDPRTGSFELIQLTGAPGCSTPRSIQSTEQGTFYHSPVGGIKFLTKGNVVHDVGSSISDSYMDGGSVIYDSVNVTGEDQQFILYFGSFAFGHLMINYSDMNAPTGGAARMSFWDSFVSHTTDNLGCSYLGFCNDTLYMANVYNNNSKLLKLSTTKYTDVGQINITNPTTVYVPLWIHTGYLNLRLDAHTRARKVSWNGYMKNNGALLTTYNSSFDNGRSDQESWGSNEVSDITTKDLNLVHTIRFQKGRAFKFEFQTTAPEPTPGGVLPDPGKAEFYSITIETGGKKPLQEKQIGKTA